MTKPASRRSLRLQCAFLACILAVSTWLLIQAERRFSEAVYPLAYADLVEETAQEQDLPPSLLYAIIHTESHFHPQAVSSAGAKGLMQITDDTYQWALQRAGQENAYSPENLFDPQINIACGGYILTLLREQFTDITTLLAAYNAGQGHVHEWLTDPTLSSDGETLNAIPYPETETYVKRVLAARKQYQTLYNLE